MCHYKLFPEFLAPNRNGCRVGLHKSSNYYICGAENGLIMQACACGKSNRHWAEARRRLKVCPTSELSPGSSKWAKVLRCLQEMAQPIFPPDTNCGATLRSE